MPQLKTFDVLGIFVLVWLLFFGGCQKLQNFAAPAPAIVAALNPSPNVVRITATPVSASVPVSAPVAVGSPQQTPTLTVPTLIVPNGMPVLPTATEQQPMTTPTAPKFANQATVAAWVAGPASTPTPEPATFIASFATPVPCSPFIGYLGEQKRVCDQVFATQTAEAVNDQ